MLPARALPRCGVCGAEFRTRGGVARHVQQTPACKAVVAARNRVRLAKLHAEEEHRPNSDVEDDPPQDGDLLNVVYGSPRSESVFDVNMSDNASPRSPSPPLAPPAVSSPPPAPTPPPNPRRTTVETVPDDDADVVHSVDGAAEVLYKTLESRISADFAALHAGSYGPFPSKADWDIAKWAKTEAVSNGAVNRLLELEFMHAQLETKTVREINARVDKLPSPAHFQHTEVENDQTDDKFDLYWRDPLEVIADLLADPAFADHLIWVPEKRYTDSECKTRLYNELPSGDWMYETQLLLPDGATVIPIIISSDKTELTSFTGKRSCYPVYLTIGNIAKHVRRQPGMRAQRLLAYLPTGKVDATVLSDARARKLRAHLFHDCMRTVCSSLFGPAASGIELADSVGNVRRCHPILAAYVADYPEQCLVTCIRYGQACPRCDTLVDGFGDDQLGDARHQEDTLHTIRTAADLPSKEKEAMLSDAGLNDIPEPFWADWPHANIHCAITSDILHQLIQGVGKHLVQWLVALAPTRELNARFQRLPLSQGLRHFLDGITKLANVTGSEHKAIYAQLLGCVHGIVPDDAVRAATALLDFLYMAQYECHSDDTIADMQVALSEFHAFKGTFLDAGIRTGFDLPKLHSLQHYAECIRMFGAADNYNTEATERLHIDLAKHAFRATNKRRFVAQMCRWLERKEAVHWFASYLAWRDGKTFDARLRQKSNKKHEPVVLAKRPHRRRVFFSELPLRYGVGDFRATLEEFLVQWHGIRTYRGYATVLPLSLSAALDQLPSLRTWNHVKFYTPNTQTLAAPDVLNIAYASADQARFDTVLVKTDGNDVAGQGGLEGVRVGQLRLIFKLPEGHEPAVFGRDVPDHLAYVEWFTELPSRVNAVNGMFPLRRSVLRNGKRETAIVPVMNIRRACQVFPQFGSEPVERSLTCYTILDAYDSFFLNNRADKDAYRSIYWDSAQTSDEEGE